MAVAKYLLHLFLMCSHLTNPSHSCHPAVAVDCRLLLAPLSEEEIDLVIIAGAAVQTLPHKRRAHKVCLCTGEKKDTLTHGVIQCFFLLLNESTLFFYIHEVSFR